MNLQQLKARYQELWDTCAITAARLADVNKVVQRLTNPASKAIYQAVEKDTGVPWYDIAVIHEREASGAWWAYLGNGEPWNRVTRSVPRGRGPFKSFHAGAVDALKFAPPYMARNMDWSIGGQLIHLVQYNGMGYEAFHHEWSPYIWAATNHEQRGKYESDGKFNASLWDTQIGTAAMLKRIFELDPSITYPGKITPSSPLVA